MRLPELDKIIRDSELRLRVAATNMAADVLAFGPRDTALARLEAHFADMRQKIDPAFTQPAMRELFEAEVATMERIAKECLGRLMRAEG